MKDKIELKTRRVLSIGERLNAMPNFIYYLSYSSDWDSFLRWTEKCLFICHSDFCVVFFFCVMHVVYYGITITRNFIDVSGRSKCNEFFLN